MFFCTATVFSHQAQAKTKNALQADACLPPLITPALTIPPKNQNPPRYELLADQLLQPDENSYWLIGNATLYAPGRVLLSNKLWFNDAQKSAEAFGSVRLIQPDLLVTAERIQLNQTDKTLHLEQALYQILPTRGFGQADQIDADQKTQRTFFKSASYTTCPLLKTVLQPGETLYKKDYRHDVAWEMSFDKLKLDDKTRRIYGYNGWLHFYQVPIFYLPYINTSMDERDSGLLFPEIGVHRSINTRSPTAYWKQPYYFNLAPNYDDTLSLMPIQDRGVLVDNEFRYLNRTHRINFVASGIQDSVTAANGLQYALSNGNIVTGKKQLDRWRAKLDAQQHWNDHWRSEIHWQKVSDQAFYSDIPIEPSLTSRDEVPRNVQLHYQQLFGGAQVNAQLVASDHLRLRKDAPYNYEQKPSLTLNYQQLFAQKWQASLLTDVTEFQLSHKGLNRPEGVRTYVQPQLQTRWDRPYAFSEVQLILNKLRYHLESQSTVQETMLDTTVPQAVWRSGLIFERSLSFNQLALTQTLTPEIQWLYTPYEEQSQQPLFDTQAQSLNFSNLFATNRFSGFDRIGDTHQLTFALTTELFNPDHTLQLKAAIGQIAYFTERKVSLTSQAPDATPLSDYYSQITAQTAHWLFTNTSQWQRRDVALVAANSRLQWQPNRELTIVLHNQAANLTQPAFKTETLASGLLWQPVEQWQLGGYWQYDFTQNLKTDNEYAIRYNNCCWSAELSLQEQQFQNGVYNYGFQFVVQFKGISTLGTPFSDRLKQKLNF